MITPRLPLLIFNQHRDELTRIICMLNNTISSIPSAEVRIFQIKTLLFHVWLDIRSNQKINYSFYTLIWFQNNIQICEHDYGLERVQTNNQTTIKNKVILLHARCICEHISPITSILHNNMHVKMLISIGMNKLTWRRYGGD